MSSKSAGLRQDRAGKELAKVARRESSGRSRSRSRYRRNRLVNLAQMPLRVVNNFFEHWGFGEILANAFYRVRKTCGAMLRFKGHNVAHLDEDGQVHVSQMPTAATMANPLWWIAWTIQFPFYWLISRPYTAMLLGAPAVAVGCLVIAGVTAGSMQRGLRNDRALLSQAVERQDYPAARVISDAVLIKSPQSAPDFYFRGLLEAEIGDERSAELFMNVAALELGSEQAALWLCNRIGDRQQIDRWPAADLDRYATLLSVAIEQNSSGSFARKALADVRRVQGDVRGAYDLLRPIAKSEPSIEYLLVILEKELGLGEESKTRARHVIAANQKQLEASPGLLATRLQSASLLAFLGQHRDATRLLDEGLPHVRTEQEALRLNRALADAIVLVAAHVAKSDKSPRGLMQRFEFLQKAVKFDSTSPAVIDAVMQACLEASQGNHRELLVLKEAVVQGVSSDAAHFILGTLDLYEGKIDSAISHLEIAKKQNAALPGLLNNIAYALSRQENADLDRALRLAEAAIATSGKNPYALETRGQILLKLRRWKDAISDLESAMVQSELRELIRPSLAIAYDELGMQELAQRHRELHAKGM